MQNPGAWPARSGLLGYFAQDGVQERIIGRARLNQCERLAIAAQPALPGELDQRRADQPIAQP